MEQSGRPSERSGIEGHLWSVEVEREGRLKQEAPPWKCSDLRISKAMKTPARMEKKECYWELQEARWEAQDEGEKNPQK